MSRRLGLALLCQKRFLHLVRYNANFLAQPLFCTTEAFLSLTTPVDTNSGPSFPRCMRSNILLFGRVQAHYRGGHGFVEAPEDLLRTELKGCIFASIKRRVGARFARIGLSKDFDGIEGFIIKGTGVEGSGRRPGLIVTSKIIDLVTML